MVPGPVYTHFLANAPPDTLIPDCGHYGPADGVFTAQGYHPGGVNAAMADGAVRFFSSSTNAAVWPPGDPRWGETVPE